MAELTVGSLFSGIEGIGLGLKRAGMRIVWQSEIDPFACRVLAKHWPTTPNLGDVTKVDWSTVEPVDVISGGYPCPAFSSAARGRNVAPDLWPHMRTAIAALRPRYVILENVARHLHVGFDAVVGDLTDLGYDTEWSVVSACSVGATHPRRRLFAVAYPHSDREPVFPVDGEVAGVPPVAGHRWHWGYASADDVGTDDGLPDRLDRLRALGNAVVPRIAELIGAAVIRRG
jgi:DNA (cytosine-5)-methyltransferase 1